MIDTLVNHLEKAKSLSTLSFGDFPRRDFGTGYGVVTLHRPSNVDDVAKLSALIDCIRKIADRLPVVFPLHPRTRANLEQFGLFQSLVESGNVLLTEPRGYLPFLEVIVVCVRLFSPIPEEFKRKLRFSRCRA